jgi:hypothetical protein
VANVETCLVQHCHRLADGVCDLLSEADSCSIVKKVERKILFSGNGRHLGDRKPVEVIQSFM